ncbi:pyocin large subunit [Zymobacter palmae]|uniref:Pyocin large subunit n=2 Tax=Zymobacter palmae TaxID=33074 RepID=A0A348HEE0_9GAMM|nr:pyocin large subunit [Zymobacter palmae]
MNWALKQQLVKDSGACWVLMGLANHAREDGTAAFPSIATLMEYTKLSDRTIQQKLKKLLEMGIIKLGNQKVAQALGFRADRCPTVYDLCLELGFGDIKPRGEKSSGRRSRGEIHDTTGRNLQQNGVKSTTSRGEESSGETYLEPSIKPSIEPPRVAPGADASAAGPVFGEVIPAEQIEPKRPRVDIPADMPGPKDHSAKTFRAWANYAMAYRHRYDAWPIWNARTAGQLSQLVDRVGHDLAPAVAAWYLRTNNQFYVTKGHPVSLMLTDCETLAVQCQTGRQVTATKARQTDRTQSNLSAVEEAKAMMRARREQAGGAAC